MEKKKKREKNFHRWEKKKKVHELQFMMFQAAVGGFLWRDQTDTQRLGGHTAEMCF